MGLPTSCDRPITTQWAPRVSTWASRSSSRIPSGVQGTNRGIPCARSPALTGCNPSTSFKRVDPFDDGAFVEPTGQGKLHQDAMNAGVGVELIDRRQQLALAGTGRQPKHASVHPHFPTGVLLVADIDRACGIIANEHDGEARHALMLSLQLGYLEGNLLAYPLGQSFSIELRSGHENHPG